MAAGDVVVFDAALKNIMDGDFVFDTETYKIALTDGTTTPATTTADPRWGAGGTTNFSSEECAAGGNYSAGGATSALTITANTGNATHSFADVSWTQNGSNPTDARWAILYSDGTDKFALCAIDLGAVIDLSAGDLTINLPTNLLTLSVA